MGRFRAFAVDFTNDSFGRYSDLLGGNSRMAAFKASNTTCQVGYKILQLSICLGVSTVQRRAVCFTLANCWGKHEGC
jgi:hypothetical protein